MPGFNNVAVWAVQQILEAPPDKAWEVAARCFPGISEEHVQEILAQHFTFSDDGNELFIGGNDAQIPRS